MNLEKRTNIIERLAKECNVKIYYPLTKSKTNITIVGEETVEVPTLRKTEKYLRQLKRNNNNALRDGRT